MKTDFYTKAVLTVIAVCLIILVLKEVEIIPKAHADTPALHQGERVNYGLVPVNPDGSINVKITSSSELRVDVYKVGGFWVRTTNGKLRVQLDD